MGSNPIPSANQYLSSCYLAMHFNLLRSRDVLPVAPVNELMITSYYLWTIGCQMNRAESSGLQDLLCAAGLKQVRNARDADLAVLNTCVVRQNAEDKVTGTLGYLRGLKALNPELKIIVTGCFVEADLLKLQQTYPQVDFFFPPGDYTPFQRWLETQALSSCHSCGNDIGEGTRTVVASIPIMQGCNNFCSYCIVPFRRGRERSKPAAEIYSETIAAVETGVMEVILLGQNVNSYGQDLDDGGDLSALLRRLAAIPGLRRLRFLTNHPKDMSEGLVDTMASVAKVCRHLCLPLQAGDDALLKAMNRKYTVVQYMDVINTLRARMPGIAISTDLIVGFPGETEKQFQNSLEVVKRARFDVVHVAAYSPRTGTKAAIDFVDDVPSEAKLDRLRQVEECQKAISAEINLALMGETVEVLVEGRKADKWYGRTVSDKLVFFNSDQEYLGKMALVHISKTSPWALQGE